MLDANVLVHVANDVPGSARIAARLSEHLHEIHLHVIGAKVLDRQSLANDRTCAYMPASAEGVQHDVLIRQAWSASRRVTTTANTA